MPKVKGLFRANSSPSIKALARLSSLKEGVLIIQRVTDKSALATAEIGHGTAMAGNVTNAEDSVV